MEQMSNELMALSNNEYIVAAIQMKYKKIETPKRQAVISTYIAEVYKFRGQVANPADLVDMAKDLDRKISGDDNLSLLTLEEVRVAFLHGVTGEYGDYYGINYVTLSKWITSYYFSEERLDAIKRYRRAQERKPQTTNLLSQKSVLTTAWEQEMEQIKSIEGYFNDVKEGKPIMGMIHFQGEAYGYLYKRGFLNPSKEDKERAFAQAKEWLSRRKASSTRTLLEIIDDGYDNSQANKITERDKAVRKAKAILLAEWLKSLEVFPDIQPLANKPQNIN